MWSFVETLVYKQLNLPVLDPAVGTFKEYDWVTYRARIIIMSGMGLLMLSINLCREFSALRYLSVFILITILFTIGVSTILIHRWLWHRPRCFMSTTS